MTEERRALVDLGRKSAEPDFLNELLQHSIQRLEEVVCAFCPAQGRTHLTSCPPSQPAASVEGGEE